MSIFSSALISFARRLTTSVPRLTSAASSGLTSFGPSSSAFTSFAGLRSLSSVCSTFASRSIHSPFISALPQSPSFLGSALPGTSLVETKRFAHPGNYRPNARKKRQKYSFHTRSQTAGGRAVLWRRIIARKPRLAA